MSADNIIYVKKIKSKWWVWESFVSDEESSKPNRNAKFFKTKSEALSFAHKLQKKIAYVEYGVCVI